MRPSISPRDAAYDACEQAVLTHGGFGYAKEYHVERFLREVMIARIAPVSEQLILSLHRRAGAGTAEVVLNETTPVRASRAPPQGGNASGPAKPVPRRLLDGCALV